MTTHPPQAEPHAPPLDMEMFKGCWAFTVTQRNGAMSEVLVGDVLVVNPNGTPAPGDGLVITYDDKPPEVRMCIREDGENGEPRLGVTMSHFEWWWLDEVRVLGVVVGLVRDFRRA